MDVSCVMNPYSESYVCFDPTKITHPIKTNPVDEFHHDELARVMMQPERWHAGKRTLINLHVFKVQVNQPAIWEREWFFADMTLPESWDLKSLGEI